MFRAGGNPLLTVIDLQETTLVGGGMGLLGATFTSFCCQNEVISEVGLKSGQTSPQKDRGAVRNIVIRRS